MVASSEFSTKIGRPEAEAAADAFGWVADAALVEAAAGDDAAAADDAALGIDAADALGGTPEGAGETAGGAP